MQHYGSSVKIIYFVGPKKYLQVNSKPGIPKDYTEFYSLYSSYIRKIVSGFIGIEYNEIEDVTQKILLDFLVGDYLNVYSPEKQTEYALVRYNKQVEEFDKGNRDFAPARIYGKFTSFVYEFTRVRLMGMRDKSNRRISVERSLESYLESTETDDSDVSLLVCVGTSDSEFINIEVRQLLQRTYTYLVKNTAPTGTRNFPELFLTAVADTFDRPEGLDRDFYSKQKGITISAVSMQLRELRIHLEQSGFYKDLKQLKRERYKNQL